VQISALTARFSILSNWCVKRNKREIYGVARFISSNAFS